MLESNKSVRRRIITANETKRKNRFETYQPKEVLAPKKIPINMEEYIYNHRTIVDTIFYSNTTGEEMINDPSEENESQKTDEDQDENMMEARKNDSEEKDELPQLNNTDSLIKRYLKGKKNIKEKSETVLWKI